jgi:hypothetical protein
MEEAGERWGVAQWVYAQCFEPRRFGIAKVKVECRLGQVAGIEVAGTGWRKNFSQNWGFAKLGRNGSRY